MIEKMNLHYSFTNPASVHDEEALTALELAGRQGAKINEIIDSQNTLVTETDNRLDKQDKYNETTRKETMPAAVKAEVKRNIESGEFADEINDYAGDLRAQMNNLLSSVPEGPTSMDAEVIDGRQAGTRVTHPTIGESIRMQFALGQEGKFTKTPINLTVKTGYVWRATNNTESAVSSGQYGRYTFNGEKIICVTGRDYASNMYPFVSFYDSNDNCIFNGWTADYTNHYNEYFAVPSNAAYMIVNGHHLKPNCEAYSCAPVGTFDEAAKAVDNLSVHQLVNLREDGATVTIKLPLTASNTEKLYGRIFSYDGYYQNWENKTPVYSTLFVPIDPNWISVNLREYNIGESGGAFVDENRVMIDDFSTAYPAHLEEKIIPKNARYIAISCKDATPYHNIYITMPSYRLMGLRDGGNTWAGKKVVWIGTSIPWGQEAEKSYAQELANYLGFELVPAFNPGLATHTDNGKARTWGSNCLSIAEYNAQGFTIPSSPGNWTPGSGNSYYYCTYENVFSTETADADLYVFDNVPNNGNWSTADWDMFDKENWAYTDGSSFAEHRDTFLGAMLFLMDKMYQSNPDARMVLLITCHLNQTGWANMELLSNEFNIPLINTWDKSTTTKPSLAKFLAEDGTHLSTFAHERIGRMLIGEFMSLA